jgi:hypothetical protein
MTTYTIDADDQPSESLFLSYQQDRGGVQSIAGQMYQAIKRAEAAYSNFETQLENEYADVAAYHNAKQAPVSDAVLLLRSKMAEVTGLMEAMNKAMPEGIVLFPGVPTGGERVAE